jgi:hypothetical protein
MKALMNHLFLSNESLFNLCSLRMSIFIFKYFNFSLLFLLFNWSFYAHNIFPDLPLEDHFNLLLCKVHVSILSQLGDTDVPITSLQRFICGSYPVKIVLSQTLPILIIPPSNSTYWRYLALISLVVSGVCEWYAPIFKNKNWLLLKSLNFA